MNQEQCLNPETVYTNIEFLNNVRAIATILVVVGHATISQIRDDNPLVNYAWIILYLFHMATFFIISGYLYELNRSKYVRMGRLRFIITKFLRLMIPYYTYSVLTYVITWIGLKIGPISHIFIDAGFVLGDFKTIIYQIITHDNSLDVHVWFIFNLFLIFVVISFLYEYLSRKYSPLIVLILYIIISCRFEMLEVIKSSFSELIYFLIGIQVAKQTEEKIVYYFGKIRKSIPAIIVITGVSVFICVLNQSGLLVFNDISLYGKILNKICHYISGVVLGLTFIFTVYHWSLTHSCSILKIINEYSYDIYLIHQPFLVTGIVYVLLRTVGNSFLAVMVASVLGIVASMLISKYVLRRQKILSMFFLGKL